MLDEDIRTHLCRLGLTRDQADIYATLLSGGSCSTERLAITMGRQRRGHRNSVPFDGQALDRHLTHLRKLGLITIAETGSGDSEHVPVEPSIALECMAHTRTAEVHQAHQAAKQAYRGYRRSVAPQEKEDLVEVVRGSHVAERIWNFEEAVEFEVLRFDSPPYHTHATANPVEIEKLGNGVEYRVVYSKSAVQNADYYSINIQPCIAAGEQARVLPTVPVKLTIYDQRLAIVSMSFVESEVKDYLLMVHPSSLLSALAGLFETSWRAALPMHLNDRVPCGLQPLHRRILELLSTGITDETIAELLGISRRTLSRHVEAINTRAGSVTRFQMALYAARNGWI
ncbi:helix-turn-helix transcriptional regulator [Streptomyces virginiae]|uniref:helix-turn-helix transcriptional regulator n=1 Tax=Streptomyces virginiae TaxID=1961 RepID=UPI002DBCAA51|nr:helix-turn-helix domain-containing protein [Streptomyces sp. CMAA1738]MEC4570235.1 HTH domain-containing protein [Streptomyces sp. CMAA1738]